MAEPVLSIGGVQFQLIEQPDTLPIGGEQAVNIIKFPGGNVNVQALGAFEDTISFAGTFWYEGALSRALQLDAFRIRGNEVLLKWANIARYVIITKFTPTIYNAEWVEYSITLQPTRSSNTLIATAATPVNTKPSTVQAEADTVVPAVNNSGKTTTAPTTQQAVRYRVQSGDTLWRIAQKFYGKSNGAKYTLIATANNIDNPNEISIGQSLIIPQ